MLHSAWLGFTALLSSSNVVSAVAMNFWQNSDICNEADIAWDGDKGPFGLDHGKTAKVITRNRHFHARTRERVLVRPGDSDEIEVGYEIKFTDEQLQDAISIVHGDDDDEDGNSVALIIDGSELDWHGGFARECIVATTHVALPKSMNHLIFDLDNSPVDARDVKSKLEKLELFAKNGAIRFRDSQISADEFIVSLHNGAFTSSDSTFTAVTANVHSNNGAVHGRFAGNPIGSLEASSNNGAVAVVVVDSESDRDSSSTSSTSARTYGKTSRIAAKSSHGHVSIWTHLRGPFDLLAHTSTGAIKTDIYNVGDSAGIFSAETKVGAATVSGESIKVTRSKKTITGIHIEGTYGKDSDASVAAADSSEPRSTVDLSTSVGAVKLTVHDGHGSGSDNENVDLHKLKDDAFDEDPTKPCHQVVDDVEYSDEDYDDRLSKAHGPRPEHTHTHSSSRWFSWHAHLYVFHYYSLWLLAIAIVVLNVWYFSMRSRMGRTTTTTTMVAERAAEREGYVKI